MGPDTEAIKALQQLPGAPTHIKLDNKPDEAAIKALGQLPGAPTSLGDGDDEPRLTIGINLVDSRKCNRGCYFAKSDPATCDCICDGNNHGIERELDKEPMQQELLPEHNGFRFMTKDDFFKNKDRMRSREVDFGVWWRDGRNYPVYRVSWIEATGEVYAIDQTEDRIEILGTVPTEEAIEKALDGWAGMCGLMNSLQWVRDRVKV